MRRFSFSEIARHVVTIHLKVMSQLQSLIFHLPTLLSSNPLVVPACLPS